MEVKMNEGIFAVDEGNRFVQEELKSYGIKLTSNKEVLNFNGEPKDRKEFIQQCSKILKKAKDFFVLVIDGIDIPAENRGDYQEFFHRLLSRKKLSIIFFTSDNVLEGEDIFHDFQTKAMTRKNIAFYIDERLRPSKVRVEPFGMVTLLAYPNRFMANEREMVSLKP